MNGIIVFFIVLGVTIFLLALIIAVHDEVRFQRKFSKSAKHWAYRNTKKVARVVHRTGDFLAKSHKDSDRPEQNIDEVMKVESNR